jgi:hypothetical protein
MTTQSRIADGPINGSGWYILDDPPLELIAPGGVVLLSDDTLTPHADAEAAAQSAWTTLRRHQAANTTETRSGQLSGQHP